MNHQSHYGIQDPGHSHTVTDPGHNHGFQNSISAAADQFIGQFQQVAQTDPNLARYRHQDKLVKLFIAGQLSAEELRWILTRLTN